MGSVGSWNPQCGARPLSCFTIDPITNGRIQVNAFATVAIIGGVSVPQAVWCPTLAQPEPSAQALREEALRLLPAVRIGSAWTQRALVNAQTILWADTPPDRTLPTVTVVGHRVALRISFHHASWNFGDHHSDTTTSPGKRYDRTSDPCRTAQCPDYYGHTYSDTGPVTIALTVAWHAQFSVDNSGTWTDIDQAPLTGPAATDHLTLVQARAVLVPDP